MEYSVSSASRVIIAIIPIVGIVMGGIVVFSYVLWTHKERVLMMEKGVLKPSIIELNTFCMLAGVLLVSVGLTLSLALFFIVPFGYATLGGLIPLSVGIGFLAFYKLNTRRNRT
jgi:hypothetical protein